jgi:hypothetical protein
MATEKENIPPITAQPQANIADFTATHARRNPLKEIIPPRQRGSQKKSAAEKASLDLARKHRQSKAKALGADINMFLEQQESKIEELAAIHGRKVTYIKHLVLKDSTYKKTRAPNLKNAKFHHKAKEMNEGECTTYLSCTCCSSFPMQAYRRVEGIPEKRYKKHSMRTRNSKMSTQTGRPNCSKS